MATEHSAIADPDIHEPKNVASANSGDVYVADGAGSGSWTEGSGLTYGELFFTGSTIATLTTTSATYVLMEGSSEGWVSELSNNLTLSSAASSMTIITPGIYEFSAYFTLKTTGAIEIYKTAFAIDGTASTQGAPIRRDSGIDEVGAYAMSSLLDLDTSAAITIMVQNEAGTNTPIATDCTFLGKLLKAD